LPVRVPLRFMPEFPDVDAEKPVNCATPDETSMESEADEVQVAEEVRSFVVLSEYMPVAVS